MPSIFKVAQPRQADFDAQIRALEDRINTLQATVTALQKQAQARPASASLFTSANAVAGAAGNSFFNLTGTSPISVSGGVTSTGFSFALSLANSGVSAGSATLLKLTGGGSDGSITVNAQGLVTSLVAPT